ncbi:MAG: hypothetical protein AVDCRST_MAG95-1895, partial [uncultured Adhaeribacter sp.]
WLLFTAHLSVVCCCYFLLNQFGPRIWPAQSYRILLILLRPV